MSVLLHEPPFGFAFSPMPMQGGGVGGVVRAAAKSLVASRAFSCLLILLTVVHAVTNLFFRADCWKATGAANLLQQLS